MKVVSMKQQDEGTTGPRIGQALDPVPPLDIAGVVRVVWHGKWLILLAVVTMVSVAGYYAFKMTSPRYAATATLKIDLQPTTLRDVANQGQSPGTDLASLNTEVTVLTSNQVLGQVVHDLNLLADPEFNRYLRADPAVSINGMRTHLRHWLAGTTETPPDTTAVLEKTIQNLRGTVTATRPRDTYIFQVTARSGSAVKAALISNTTAEIYVANQVQAKDTASHAAERWLSDRVAALQIQLETQEMAVTNLIATAQIQEDAVLDTLSNQVLAVEQELDAAQAEHMLLAAKGTGTARNAAELAQLQSQIAALTANRDRLKAQLSTQSAGLVALHQMQREADATRVLYESFLARLQETRIQRGLEYPDSQVIAPATSARYVGPQKMLILQLAAFTGTVIGLGIVMLRAGLRPGILDTAELRRVTGCPVLAQVPLNNSKRPGRMLRRLARTPTSPMAEAIRDLRTSLFLNKGDAPPQVILSTSSLPQEGKTTHALALAQNLSMFGKSVIVVGADLRDRGFQAFLSRPGGYGLVDVLSGTCMLSQAIAQDARIGCSVLFGQTASAENPADLLASDAFSDLIATLRATYDHIIIDTPPVLMAPDTRVLAQYADAIVYAVRWTRTPVSAIKSGLETLDDVGPRQIGLVLSQVNLRKLRRYGQSPYASFGTAALTS